MSRRMLSSMIEIILGVILLLCASKIADEFWSGMGGAMIGVGVVNLIRQIRYKTDVTYREHVDIQVSDERNRYISMKAWSWAGYLFVLVAAVTSIVGKMAGREELMYLASTSVCLMLLFYWGSYMVLRRKY